MGKNRRAGCRDYQGKLDALRTVTNGTKSPARTSVYLNGTALNPTSERGLNEHS
jgi:hypothetical protein